MVRSAFGIIARSIVALAALVLSSTGHTQILSPWYVYAFSGKESIAGASYTSPFGSDSYVSEAGPGGTAAIEIDVLNAGTLFPNRTVWESAGSPTFAFSKGANGSFALGLGLNGDEQAARSEFIYTRVITNQSAVPLPAVATLRLEPTALFYSFTGNSAFSARPADIVLSLTSQAFMIRRVNFTTSLRAYPSFSNAAYIADGPSSFGASAEAYIENETSLEMQADFTVQAFGDVPVAQISAPALTKTLNFGDVAPGETVIFTYGMTLNASILLDPANPAFRSPRLFALAGDPVSLSGSGGGTGAPMLTFTVEAPAAPVPEPLTYVMLLSGLALIVVARRQRLC